MLRSIKTLIVAVALAAIAMAQSSAPGWRIGSDGSLHPVGGRTVAINATCPASAPLGSLCSVAQYIVPVLVSALPAAAAGNANMLRTVSDGQNAGDPCVAGGGITFAICRSTGSAWAQISGSGGSMVYPSAGVPNSTGSAWGTSYAVGTGANNLLQLNGSSQLPAVSAALLTNFPTLNQNTSGNAATATALAANGTNCAAGSYPLGVDASGNSEGCTAALAAYSGSVTATVGVIVDGACSTDSTMTVTGANTGDQVYAGWPATLPAGITGTMLVSASNTVAYRLCNLSGSAVNLTSATYSARLVK